MRRGLHPQVEPCILPPLDGDWFAFLNEAVEVKGHHSLETVQGLRDVRAEVRKLESWNLGDDAIGFSVPGEDDLVEQRRRTCH
jgi:hypothetical protein